MSPQNLQNYLQIFRTPNGKYLSCGLGIGNVRKIGFSNSLRKFLDKNQTKSQGTRAKALPKFSIDKLRSTYRVPSDNLICNVVTGFVSSTWSSLGGLDAVDDSVGLWVTTAGAGLQKKTRQIKVPNTLV